MRAGNVWPTACKLCDPEQVSLNLRFSFLVCDIEKATPNAHTLCHGASLTSSPPQKKNPVTVW